VPTKLLFLGVLSYSTHSLLRFLSEHGYEVTVINACHLSTFKRVYGTNIPVYNLYENSKISAMFKGPQAWRRKAILYELAKNLNLKRDALRSILDETETELVYGTYGTRSLPECGMAQKLHVPLVYEFLCYPWTFRKFGEDFDNFMFKRIVNSLDGRVFPSQRMYDYMKNVLGIHTGENLFYMECFPEKFYYRRRLPLLSEVDGQPHIVFTGSNVRARMVFSQIEEIASRRIHVHLARAPDEQEDSTEECTFKDSGFVHPFTWFSFEDIADGTYATFLTQFDACVVTNNFWRYSCQARFHNTIPSRFSLTIPAGIPFVVPEGYMQACEDIINEYQIGFAYRNYTELRDKLYDKSMMKNYQENAIKNAQLFSLESNFVKLDKFLKRLIE